MPEMNVTFGRFTLKAMLGKGSFGEVYKAFDPNLNKDVALKVLHQGLMQDVGFLKKAAREASLVSKIQHPNVAKIHELGETDGRAYISMEFIDGWPLSRILQTGKRFNVGQVISLIEQIASALDATHKSTIVHRDVKPANIMIDRSGQAHLVDFGLAYAAKSSLGASSNIASLGTAAYMSPEQANGQVGDKKTDIYSLGIVAYELLTGKLPFEEENLPGYIGAHINKQPPDPLKLNPAITRPMRDVLMKVLSKKPESRYASASVFAHALQAASEKTESNRFGLRGCLVTGLVMLLLVAVFALGGLAWNYFNGQILAAPVRDETANATVDSLFASPTRENTPIPASPLEPTFTPESPVNVPPAEPPTNTPSPTDALPTIAPATPTTAANLIFEDTFDFGINKNNWLRFGTWIISNGQPVFVQDYTSEFRYGGALILPGTSTLNNIAVEFDFPLSESSFAIIFGYQADDNFKAIKLSQRTKNYTSMDIGPLIFYKNDTSITIPESNVFFIADSINRLRIELKDFSLSMFINGKLVYDFQSLPDSVSGGIGFATGQTTPQVDNFSIYQLP